MSEIEGAIVSKFTSGSLSALLVALFAYLVLDFAFYEIDTKDVASLVGMAAVIGAIAGAWFSDEDQPET